MGRVLSRIRAVCKGAIQDDGKYLLSCIEVTRPKESTDLENSYRKLCISSAHID